MDLETDDRIEKSKTIYKEMKIPSKYASMITFSNQDKLKQKQYFTIANNKLKMVMEGGNNTLENLMFLSKSLKELQNKELLNSFCEHFPYADFFNLVANNQIPEVRMISLQIFSYCTNSVKFPRNSFSKPQNINYVFSLFSQIDHKYHQYLFNILNECIIKRPDIRNYLLKNGILNFHDPYSDKAVEFLATCLSTEPNIEKGYANSINAFLLFSCKETKQIKLIIPVLNIFARRKKNSCKLVNDPNVIDPELIKFIFTDLIQMNKVETFVPILKIASYINLNEQIYITIVMNFMGRVSDKRVVRCCMKTLQKNYSKWRVHQEIVQTILNFLNAVNGNLPFIIQQNLVQVLMLYTLIEPQMSISSIQHVMNFINDTEIGTHSLAFIYQSLNTILKSGGSNESKEKAKNFIASNIDQLERIALGQDGIDEDSHELAQLILNLIQ